MFVFMTKRKFEEQLDEKYMKGRKDAHYIEQETNKMAIETLEGKVRELDAVSLIANYMSQAKKKSEREEFNNQLQERLTEIKEQLINTLEYIK